jgi:hypothetical protein
MDEISVAAEGGALPSTGVQPAEAVTSAPEPAVSEQQDQQAKQEQERTFSQAEMDAAVQRRVAKERRRFERELRSMVEQRQAQSQAPADDEPKREQFQDYESYLEARAEFKARKTAGDYVAQTMAERARATEAADLSMAAQEVIERGRAAYKDFDAQIDAAFEAGVIPRGGPLHHGLIQADDGHKLAYHLATNPADAARIAQLPAARQLVELGRLSARLEKTVSRAPEPPKPVSSGAGSPVEKDWWGRSPAEILRERAKERTRR